MKGADYRRGEGRVNGYRKVSLITSPRPFLPSRVRAGPLSDEDADDDLS